MRVNIVLRLLQFICLIFFSVLIYFSISLYHLSYPQFIESVYQLNPDSCHIDEFAAYCTFNRFSLIKKGLPIFAAFLLILIIFYRKVRRVIEPYLHRIDEGFNEVISGTINQLKILPLQNKIVLITVFFLIIISRVYLFERYPFNGDEILSYYSFIRNGFLFTLTYYPTTNNHIFYNLVCIPFSYLFNDPLWTMRFPNVIINLIILFILFIYIHKKTDFYTAILCLILSAFSFSCSIYSVHGRGYILECFFAIISLFSVMEINNNKKRSYSWFLLICCSILGLFTIVLYILPLAGIIGFGMASSIVNSSIKTFRKFLLAIFIIGTGSFLLYSPTIFVSGLDAVFNNSIIAPYSDLKYYFSYIVPVASVEAIDFIVGTLRGGYLILCFYFLLLLIFYYKFNSFEKSWIHFSIICVVSTFLIFFVKRVFGEPRYFTFYGFLFFNIFGFIVAKIISDYKNLFKILVCTSIAIGLILIMIFQFDRKMDFFYGSDYLKSYADYDKMINYISSKSPNNIYINDIGLTGRLLYFNSTHKNKAIHLTTNSLKTEKKYNYNFIIIKSESDFPLNNRLDYRRIDNSLDLICYEKIK